MISYDRDYEEEEDYTCPLCCIVAKYFLVFALLIFFIITPALMIYIGLNYGFCEDMFSMWLLVGKVKKKVIRNK